MPEKFRPLPFLILLSLIVVIGCAGPRHRPHATKLSKAMEKASDDNTEDNVIHTEHHRPQFKPHHHHEAEDWDTTDPESDSLPSPSEGHPALAPGERNALPGVFALSAGYGIIKGEDVYQLNHIDLSFGGYLDEKNRLEGFVGYGYALIDKTSELNDSIKDASMLSLGARYKYFTTPRYTFLGHYFTVGLAYSKLLWSYQNPVFLEDREINHDSLEGLEVFAGMGLHLAQTEHIQFGLEILPSLTLWSPYTEEGFDNDVFGPFYMLKLRFTLSFL